MILIKAFFTLSLQCLVEENTRPGSLYEPFQQLHEAGGVTPFYRWRSWPSGRLGTFSQVAQQWTLRSKPLLTPGVCSCQRLLGSHGHYSSRRAFQTGSFICEMGSCSVMKEAAYCEEETLALESASWNFIPRNKSLPWSLKQITFVSLLRKWKWCQLCRLIMRIN